MISGSLVGSALRRSVYRPVPRLSFISFVGKRFLNLKVEQTPNENALKFVSKEKRFLPSALNHSIQIETLNDAFEVSPLAQKLFKINGVKSLMIGENFISVNKVGLNELSHSEELKWDILKPKIVKTISEHMDENLPVLSDNYSISDLNNTNNEGLDSDDDLTYEIKELIRTRIQPALQDDGGDIKFRKFDPESGVVYIKLQGACKSCSLSTETLKNGIEQMLKHYIEEVNEVKAILDPEEEIAINEFEKFEKKLKNKDNQNN
ncbi:hypothetical protein PACTADRAFT_77752 [Pachysolen tannophilus NRRL Y-2460]|uniref:Scaffold protein Nfu/NifU N-terminal domain-containing protein n=1 Tax=Pachysolen tannophilus NRRL Y-2460 TaxID=669874 RepID=A0A1E4TNS4_PACTA|nr:hypothetical protein PACTADRAFT_77752 [Pachysolen tannophilus NRRL Y-2460]